jgi:uncharacterized protein YdbL (DUF1318 family)
MRNLLGVAFTVVAVWFVYTSVTLRVRRLVERRAAGIHDHEEPATRMFVFGEIMRPIILFFLTVLAIKAIFAYFWLDAARYLSLFDLGGFVAALAGYGYWVVVKTKVAPLALFQQASPEAKPAYTKVAANDSITDSDAREHARRRATHSAA